MSTARKLLVCDLDGTLLGNARDLERLLDRLRAPAAPVLAFATGRQYFSAIDLLEQWQVDAGSYLIAGVGTEMYVRESELWRPLPWPPLPDRWNAARIRELLAGIDGLVPQPVTSELKVSFYADRAVAQRVSRVLIDAGVEATVVHSHGDLLDVLPPSVDKGAAVQWLAARLDIPLTNVMTCGDTENDLAMLALCGPAVIVGNARAELRASASRIANVYIARSHAAGGILEGLERYGWITAHGWAHDRP